MRTANALRINARFPKKAWAECVRTATFIENRLPTTANPLNKSPFEMLYNRPPDLSILRVIGSKAYVHIHAPTTLSTDPKAKIGRLLGYSPNTNGYRILLDERTGSIVDTIHVTFSEKLQDSNQILLTLPGSLPEHQIRLRDPPKSTPASGVGGITIVPPSVDSPPKEQNLPFNPPQSQQNNHVIIDDEILSHIDPILIPNSYRDNHPQRQTKPVDRLTYDVLGTPRGTTKFARAKLVKSA
eukprot:gene31085-53334_t